MFTKYNYFKKIVIDTFGDLNNLKYYLDNGFNLNEEMYQKLYEIFCDEMPYDVQKARIGDPYEWLYEKMYHIYYTLIPKMNKVYLIHI